MKGDHEDVVLQTKKPCHTVGCVVTQVMGAVTEARPRFELVTQVSGIKPDKLPTKPVLYLGNLQKFANC